MAKRRDWRTVVWKETLADGQTVCRVKLSDSRTPPGHVLFGRRVEQLAGLLKDARKAHEDAVHRSTLNKTKPLPFPKRKRIRKLSDIDLTAGSSKPVETKTAKAEAAETLSA